VRVGMRAKVASVFDKAVNFKSINFRVVRTSNRT
jgi:hypothetical protein